MSNDNAWKWWQDALAGNFGPIHDSDPQQGYYRTRFKDKPWEPVAIWFENGEWHAMRGERAINAAEIWTFCCRNPISYEAYNKAIDGGGWDDEPEAPAIGHNLPSDPFEALQVEFEAEKEQVAAFLKKPITTQADADRAAIWSKRLATIAKKATDLHKVEKQPSLDESRRIDDKWRGLKEDPADLSKRLKRHMDAYLQEQQRLEQERQRKAREEADRIAREADEARIAAEKAAAKQVADGIADAAAIAEHNNRVAEAERLAQQAADAEREAQARNASAGRTGARVALRTFVNARVNDYQAAATALVLMKHPDLLAVIDQLANRAIKAGQSLPGVERVEEQRAA
ncbi:hypothetical protein [Neorhizobium sp. S3-V5DH]|uniref:hypothetical protein n=1 Tax=Neorhizobium sp. S3-V5DH TaxID=2485166 RepID=UPI001052A43A|nr:hypothetical protein [Neorhizobium sp. S3-V5DH]TCV66318.1 hypothetical protein EDE09_11669 [Neorhizobium sp. S3-V5DH]